MVGMVMTKTRLATTWKICELAGQSASASQAMMGETFPGWNRSNALGSVGAAGWASAPGTSAVIRVRAEGEIALDRTPYLAPSIAMIRESATIPSLAAP